jgi:WD40 repeat protein
MLRFTGSLHRLDEYRSQMKKVASLLRIRQRPDAILLATNVKQHTGTCQWLTECHTFQEWVDNAVDYREDIDSLETAPEDQGPNILWLNGRPGTGKTVAAGHVIRYLQTCNLDCSFYFFEHKDKTDATVAAFLRSIAFQMAESSFEVRRAIVSMAEDDIRLSNDDHHLLWTSLFIERIFRVELTRPQYWVIDAVDECSTKGMPALISMLSTLDSRIPVRIFMTSLPGGQLERLFTLERTEYSQITTGEEGSLRDIELLAKARCPRESDVGPYQDLVSDVIAKSNGIFLWASLTVAKLEDAYSVEDKQDVLRQIPLEMDMFYSRIIASIAKSPSSELAKCILKWTICSPKPLHFEELAEAVRLDIGRTLMASAKQLETLTGHLVFVDSDSRIHIAHQTASAFLTQQRDVFWIDRTKAHSQIAEVCLKVLCSPDFVPLNIPRRGTTTGGTGTVHMPLLNYATYNFSYHLVHGSSSATAPLTLLSKFLKSNVLAWIERIASTGSLENLQLTAQRLKAYLGRRAKYEPPVSMEIRTVAAWAADMYRISAAFHSSLLRSPSSIYFLIPHFCPPKSIIRQLFAKPTKRLKIMGQVEDDWNDRLACYLFPEEASAVASSVRLLAVGLANGDIRTYYISGSGTFDAAGTLTHGKRIRHLAFNPSSSLLASCSARKLIVWDVRESRGPSFTCLWSQDIDFTASCMVFHPGGSSILLADHHQSKIVSIQAADGHKQESIHLHVSSDSDSSDDSEKHVSSWTPSEQIRFDPSHRLAALAYRNASVSLWDLNHVEKIGTFEKEGFENVYAMPQTLDMIFNPVPELELFAVTYKDGDIVTCNPWTLEQKNKFHLQGLLVALAATTDGRVLAGAAEDGGIYLFLFETLQPLYQISRPNDQLQVHSISFSADNLRLFDIRGQCCNIWEPFVLVPRDGLDDSSSEPHSEAVSLPESPASHPHVFQWGEAITAIENSTHGNFLLVGRQDGSIDICESSSGDVIDNLTLHDAFTEIELIDWNERNSCMLSVDITGRCIVTRLSSIRKGTRVQSNCLLDHREWASVRQALIDPSAKSILICTESSVKIIGLDGSTVAELTSLPGSWWTRHPSNNHHLIAICDSRLHLFEWRLLKSLLQTDGVSLLPPELDKQKASHRWVGGSSSSYLVQGVLGSKARRGHLVAFETSNITAETKEVPLQVLKYDSLNIQSLLGCFRSSLYFLDTSGWVCSITLKILSKATQYTRHFFIPHTWRTGADVIKIISKTAVAFGRGEWLIIFQGSLELDEKVPL